MESSRQVLEQQAGFITSTRTKTLDDDGSGPLEDSLCLRLLFDSGQPHSERIGTEQTLCLKPGSQPIIIGRETRLEDGRLLIADPSVSRRHLAVKCNLDQRSVTLQALNSKNDTYVNGALLQGTRIVGEGTVLRLAGTIILISSMPALQNSLTGRVIPRMRGTSSGLQKVARLVSQRCDSSAPVILWGESGVGKELVAEALHENRINRTGPFKKINCATLNPTLAGSELFGHERGAFTGATSTTRGLFREAAGGTLFLDEIHLMALEVQGLLLRALDSGTIRSVGGTGEQQYDVRVVAASNQDLSTLSGRSVPGFLPDLRARLGDWYRIYIPPLRERREDILPIFLSLLDQEATLRNRGWILELPWSWRLADMLTTRTWRNNVRDLRIVAQSLVDATPRHASSLSLAPIEEFLPAEDISENRNSSRISDNPPMRLRREKSQRLSLDDIAELKISLSRHDGSAKAAAMETGITERHIRKLVQKWRTEADQTEGSEHA